MNAKDMFFMLEIGIRYTSRVLIGRSIYAGQPFSVNLSFLINPLNLIVGDGDCSILCGSASSLL